MLLLFSSSAPLNDLGSVQLDLAVNLLADVSIGAAVSIEVQLTSSLNVYADLFSSPRQSEVPAPRRHYIWVHDIHGVRVDVIA